MDDLKIIDYINDQLTKDERQAFELELKNDSALAERYAYLKNVAAASGVSGMRQSIKKVEKELEQENFFETKSRSTTVQQSSKSKRFIFSAIAASLLLFLIIGLFRINKNCSDQAIAQSFMKGEKLSSSTTRDEGVTLSTHQQTYQFAIKQFYDGQLNKASKQLGTIPPSESIYLDAQYALGLIEFKQGNYSKSMQVVQPLLANKDHRKDKSAWLYLNAQICENGFSEELVKQFIATNPEDFYLKKAQNLLKTSEHPFRALVF